MFPNFLCDFSLHQRLATFLKGTSIICLQMHCTVHYSFILGEIRIYSFMPHHILCCEIRSLSTTGKKALVARSG